MIVFAALVTGAVFVALHTFFQQTDQPAPVAASYYLAFMTQDYPKAYAELESQATINGQKVDEQTFRHLATTADALKGKVTGYGLDSSNSASLFTVTVHRGGQNYTVHLQLKLEGSGWRLARTSSDERERKHTMTTIATRSQPATSSPLKRLITRHPLLAFFVIAFAGAWIVTLPLVLAQNGLGLLPYTVSALGPIPPAYWFAALAAIAGPTLASFTVTAVTAGKTGVRQLLRRYVLWRVGLRWYLLVLVGVPLIQLAFSSVFLGTAPLTAFIQQWPLFFTAYLPDTLIIVVAVQLWEEGGWSGFAVPNLQQRLGAWRTALILGPLWAVFHLPFYFVPGQLFPGKVDAIAMVVQMVLSIIVAIATRMIMTWVFNNTKASILIAVLLHAALDASNSGNAFIKHLVPASQLGAYGLGSLVLFPLVAAVVLLIFTKGRLSYRPDRVGQPVEAPRPAEISSIGAGEQTGRS